VEIPQNRRPKKDIFILDQEYGRTMYFEIPLPTCCGTQTIAKAKALDCIDTIKMIVPVPMMVVASALVLNNAQLARMLNWRLQALGINQCWVAPCCVRRVRILVKARHHVLVDVPMFVKLVRIVRRAVFYQSLARVANTGQQQGNI
jgi:hypothetical protein